MKVLSLGAGVQSSTLLRMANEGEIEGGLDFAIFSDTGWEPAHVYRHLESLEKYSRIPVLRVSAGNVKQAALETKDSKRFKSIPLFGERGPLPRMCTGDFKIKPVISRIKQLFGISGRANLPAGSCELWIGISYDEIRRMKQADRKWIQHRWPLIEMKMSREDCLDWCDRNGFPRPPRSSCVGCPFHTDNHWKTMKEERPDEFAEAVKFDEDMRQVGALETKAFLHRSRIPLAEVDFERKEKDQMIFEECAGFCNT